MDYLSISGRSSRTVKFEAFTDSVSWRTGYIMNLDSTSGDINFIMYIRASQKTGLDYSGIITFYTKTPDENLTSPSLAPMKVELKPRETRPGLSFEMANYDTAAQESPLDNLPEITSQLKYTRTASIIRETLLDTIIQVQDSITGDGREAEIPVRLSRASLK